jgi:hypothetical protein
MAGARSAELAWWERVLLALFGAGVAGFGSVFGSPWGAVPAVIGWSIVAAALGLVELVMAVAYRLVRWHRGRRRSGAGPMSGGGTA